MCAEYSIAGKKIRVPGMLAFGLEAKGKMLEKTGTKKSLGLLVTQTGHTSHGHWSVATQTEAPWLVTLTVHWPSLAIP